VYPLPIVDHEPPFRECWRVTYWYRSGVRTPFTTLYQVHPPIENHTLVYAWVNGELSEFVSGAAWVSGAGAPTSPMPDASPGRGLDRAMLSALATPVHMAPTRRRKRISRIFFMALSACTE